MPSGRRQRQELCVSVNGDGDGDGESLCLLGKVACASGKF